MKRHSQRYDVRLANCERLHAIHPDTFEILSRDEREAVHSGNIVKLIFETEDPDVPVSGERMWVIVRECIEGEVYLGTLDNDPVFLPLKYGAWIQFRPEHILDIHSSALR